MFLSKVNIALKSRDGQGVARRWAQCDNTCEVSTVPIVGRALSVTSSGWGIFTVVKMSQRPAETVKITLDVNGNGIVKLLTCDDKNLENATCLGATTGSGEEQLTVTVPKSCIKKGLAIVSDVKTISAPVTLKKLLVEYYGTEEMAKERKDPAQKKLLKEAKQSAKAAARDAAKKAASQAISNGSDDTTVKLAAMLAACEEVKAVLSKQKVKPGNVDRFALRVSNNVGQHAAHELLSSSCVREVVNAEGTSKSSFQSTKRANKQSVKQDNNENSSKRRAGKGKKGDGKDIPAPIGIMSPNAVPLQSFNVFNDKKWKVKLGWTGTYSPIATSQNAVVATAVGQFYSLSRGIGNIVNRHKEMGKAIEFAIQVRSRVSVKLAVATNFKKNAGVKVLATAKPSNEPQLLRGVLVPNKNVRMIGLVVGGSWFNLKQVHTEFGRMAVATVPLPPGVQPDAQAKFASKVQGKLAPIGVEGFASSGTAVKPKGPKPLAVLPVSSGRKQFGLPKVWKMVGEGAQDARCARIYSPQLAVSGRNMALVASVPSAVQGKKVSLRTSVRSPVPVMLVAGRLNTYTGMVSVDSVIANVGGSQSPSAVKADVDLKHNVTHLAIIVPDAAMKKRVVVSPWRFFQCDTTHDFSDFEIV